MCCPSEMGPARCPTALVLPNAVDGNWQAWLASPLAELKSHKMPATFLAVPRECLKIFSTVFSHIGQQAEQRPECDLNTEVSWVWQELFEITANRHYRAFLKENFFLSVFPAMELVCIHLQLVSSASCWQHQKEISGQTASPLKAAPSSAEIKPSVPGPLWGAAADCGAREETPHMVGNGGRGGSLHTQKAKSDPWLSWERKGKGDHGISAPRDRLGHTRWLSLFIQLPPGCCSLCSGDVSSPKALHWAPQRPCWKADSCESHRGLPPLHHCPNLCTSTGFFLICQMSIPCGEILYSGHFSQLDL